MSVRGRLALSAVLIAVAAVDAAVAIGVAAPSGADCVSSNGTTLCSQGSSRGADTGEGPGTMSGGPYVPYPCAYDWNCGGGGLSIVLSPGSPGISIGRPR
ncbi:MAG TPA: hypothetical protein PLH92_02085 [Mycobacterium sp.]|uniref:hypothetical protein n=1 Tax=Mycolicibacterium sp. TaxID=2320850 RepID=UPI0025FE0648|nr:hypothetical protein [Mycolicibacterium sp.]HPX35556.1 hypothetical protein [Mycobacterium sp.]HQC75492.1 hypothetical protein [Mycobacterium sp.]